MPIYLAETPNDSFDLIAKHLHTFYESPEENSEILGGASPDDIHIGAPYPIYHLELNDIITGNLLANTNGISWESVIFNGEKEIVLAELHGGHNQEELSFAKLLNGDIVTKTVEAIDFIEKYVEDKNTEYELRMIRIPQLYLMAFWIHGDKDLIIPTYDSHGLNEKTVYTVTETCEKLQADTQTLLNAISEGQFDNI